MGISGLGQPLCHLCNMNSLLQERQGKEAGKINSSIYFDRNAIKVFANGVTWLPPVPLAGEEVFS